MTSLYDLTTLTYSELEPVRQSNQHVVLLGVVDSHSRHKRTICSALGSIKSSLVPRPHPL